MRLPAFSCLRLPALLAVAIFLPLLTFPGLYHLLYGLRASDLERYLLFLRTQPPHQALRSIDDDFDRRFLLRFVATALTEKLPVVRSRLRDVDVQFGSNGFRFAAEDTRVCTAAGFLHPRFPRPQQAAQQIIAFDRYLQSRGIYLLVVPVPAKASIYPDRLDPGYDPAAGPLLNPDHHAWFDHLRAAGVDAMDLTDLLWSHRDDPGVDPLFYPADTHWTDRAKRLAAAAIASHLGPHLADPPPATPYVERPFTHHVQGNLYEPGAPLAPPFIEHLVQLVYEHTPPFSATSADDPSSLLAAKTLFPQAPVLLLGDSQAANGGWFHVGFQQRLIQALGTDVASLAQPGLDPDQMRASLLTNIASLQQARAVIWVFSIRHLLIKPWNTLPLDAAVPSDRSVVAPG